MPELIKPTHKPIKTYYETLAALGKQKIKHEQGLRGAFQALLTGLGRKRHWTLVPELSHRPGAPDGPRVVPDATLRDDFNMPRGYWEAKDTGDDLDAEIRKKIKKGYPSTNIIFEDTRSAVLIQNRNEQLRADLADPQALCDLLNAFFAHTEPNIDSFEKAVDEFKQRVPELAEGLVKKIRDAHDSNKPFQHAFDKFFEVCKASLNPNLSTDAVDEMLVQHLLTIRLFRTIFDNEDFNRRNAVAAEIEKVIDALTGKSFDRKTYLKSLDLFYVAIEAAAKNLTEFSEKQHFLNTVYERFFQGYSVKVADTHGIVYTPQPIVDFMVNSVQEVLKQEFGLELWSEGVNILDPCTGTGNFVVNILNRIPKKHLPRVYAHQLFANEVMLLPYYIAALNIEHAYFEKTGEYEPFDGLCFVDTLDMIEAKSYEHYGDLFISEENAERVARQKKAKINVIIGNPPYNVGQLNENDNNKNRKYKIIDKRISDTYAGDSKASNRNALSDAYVKFFRWATDRLDGRDGIVCFVSNNGFVDQIAFDGMRKHLSQDFTHLYHVDLHGNVRKNPKLSGTTHNVFGIQVGVGVTVAVRRAASRAKRIEYLRVPEFWRKEEKLDFLLKCENVNGIPSRNEKKNALVWRQVEPTTDNIWLASEGTEQFRTFLSVGTKIEKSSEEENVKSVFKLFSGGVKSNRDDVVYDFDKIPLRKRVREFVENYNAEVDRYQRTDNVRDIDAFVKYDSIKWSRDLKLDVVRGHYALFDEVKVVSSLFRPYAKKYLFLDRILNEEVYGIPRVFPNVVGKVINALICVTNEAQIEFSAIVTNVVPCLHLGGRQGQCFPFYVYDEDGTNRRENITDWTLAEFRTHYKDKKIDKWAIFHYVYGLLHHPGYREKYADCLKRELPRIPYAPDFWAFAKAGKKLAELHLNYEDSKPYDLEEVESDDLPRSTRVEKMKLLGPDGKSARKVDSSAQCGPKDKYRVWVNDSLTLDGIPPLVFDYRLGNRSALEWVIDQYQVYTDPRSGITQDPNREDDPEYIVRLLGQVTRVSIETVNLVNALPKDFGG